MKTKKHNRFISYLLTVCMLMGMLSGITVSAAEPITVESSHINSAEERANGITMMKRATPNADGTATISIGAYTTGEVKATQAAIPTDIVLVLDVSGSMDDEVTTSVISDYNAVYAGSQSQWYVFWIDRWTGFKPADNTFYVDRGEEKIPVTRAGRDGDDYDYYTDGISNYYPKMSDSDTAARDNNYAVVQFYSPVYDGSATVTESKIDVLHRGAKAFIDTTAKKNEGITDPNLMHRISIVKYAGDSYYDGNGVVSTPSLAEGNDTYFDDGNEYNYTQVVKGLTPVTGDNVEALKAAIDSLEAGGATAIDYGMSLATEVLANATQPQGTQERAEAVIAFTDGEPNHSSGFITDYANSALATAKALKATGVTVYSISMAEGANGSVLGDANNQANRFMHFLSSNYPNVSAMSDADSYTEAQHLENIKKGYYLTPDGDHALESIFEEIGESINVPHIEMGESAVLVDSISSYFDLEKGTESITIKTADKTADGWGEAQEVTDDSIDYTLSADGKTVSVTGFDFDKNYISETNKGTAEDPDYGKILILEMVVKPNDPIIDAGASVHGGNVPTNADLAYVADSNGTKAATVQRPALTLPKITYSYTIDGANPTVHQTYYRMPNTKHTVIGDIQREGYKFSGWETTDATVEEGNFTMPNANVTITGNFDPKEYTVKYQYSGTAPDGALALLPGEELKEFGSEVTVARNPELDNYTFSGWTPLQADVTVTDGKFIMPAKEVTLVGHFVRKTASYKIEHYLETLTEGVYEATPEERELFTAANVGDEVKAMPLNRFEGFKHNPDAPGTKMTGTVDDEGNLTLKLYYDRVKYKLTYEYEREVPQGAYEQLPEYPDGKEYFEIRYGANVDVANEPDVKGYVFSGWHHDAENPIDISSGSFNMPPHDMVIHGYFTANTDTPYRVEHYVKKIRSEEYEETPRQVQNLAGTTGTQVTATAIAIEGFTYNEQDSAATKTGKIVGFDDEKDMLVLKLYYDRENYKLTYNYEGDVPADAPALPEYPDGKDHFEFYFEEEVLVEPVPQDIPVGYDSFFGWYMGTATEENKTTGFYMPARNVELLGYFVPSEPADYKVEHYLMTTDGSGYELADEYTEILQGTDGVDVTAHPLPNLVNAGFSYNDIESTATGTVVAFTDEAKMLVLRLYYDRVQYKVTYEYERDVPEGAEEQRPKYSDEQDYFEFYHGQTVDIEDEEPSVLGYTFSGWHLHQNNGQETYVDEFTMPMRHVVIYGYFTAKTDTKYKVEHYVEKTDGSDYEDTPHTTQVLEGTTGSAVTASPIEITGFKYNDTESAATKTGTIIAVEDEEDMLVLKLYYDRNSYKLTYGYDGTKPDGASDAPKYSDERDYFEFLYEQPVDVEDLPTVPTGYHFVGWYRGTADRLVPDRFDMPAFDVHLLGTFVPNSNTPYRVEHHLQNLGGEGYTLDHYDNRIGTTDDEVSAIPREYPGFEYNAGISISEGEITGDGKFALKFYYDRVPYDVTYKFEGMVPATLNRETYAITTEDILFGKSVDVTVIPENEYKGYIFSGWKTEDATVENGKFTMPAKNVVLVGSFTADLNTYKVKHWLENLSGDTTGEQGPDGKYYTLQTDDTEEYTDRRTGALVEAIPKQYQGFSARGDNVLTGNIAGDGSLVLNVYYDRNKHNVRYIYFDDGNLPENRPDIPTSYNQIDVPYGTKLEVEDKLELTGFIFDGWHTTTASVSEEEGKKVYTMPDHDVIFWARYQDKHLVKYDLNGGTGASGVDYSDKEVPDGTLITVNDSPTRSGYSFTGWLAGETEFNSGDTHTVNADITFVAQWRRNGGGGGGITNYTLTYETNGGNDIAKETYASGTKVDLNKVPEKDGYTFDGWYLDKGLTEKVTSVKMTKHITVYAKWKNNEEAPTHPVPGGLNGKDHFAYVVGYPDGNVKPNNNITRAEVATIFFRLLQDETRDNNLADNNAFADVKNGVWYNKPISTLAKLGIVEGRSAKDFDPDAYITRAEFAAIAARFDNQEYEIVDEFTDVDGHWAEAEIHEAAAYGWIKGYEDGKFHPDQLITRAEAMLLINRVLNRIPENASDLLDDMIKWPDNADKGAWYYIAIQEATNSHEYDVKSNGYEKWSKISAPRDWTQYEK